MYVPKDWSKISNEELVEALRYAAAAGYDNREERDDIQKEILRRLSSRDLIDLLAPEHELIFARATARLAAKEIKRYTMVDPVELAALKTQAAYLREVLQGISMMSEEAVLEEPDRAQRIAREALYATKPKETL